MRAELASRIRERWQAEIQSHSQSLSSTSFFSCTLIPSSPRAAVPLSSSLSVPSPTTLDSERMKRESRRWLRGFEIE